LIDHAPLRRRRWPHTVDGVSSTQPATQGTSALRIAVEPEAGEVVVRLIGDIDASTAPLIAEALSQSDLSTMPLVVVDVRGARFWDVSGLHVLAAFSTGVTASGRRCRVVGATAPTRRLVGLADFTCALRLEAA
jgi:anti-anti-sigma factor